MGRSKSPSLSPALAITDISITRVEVAVKQILCGMNVKTSASVANSECLDWYRAWAQKHEPVSLS
jgi:hypothetical protein